MRVCWDRRPVTARARTLALTLLTLATLAWADDLSVVDAGMVPVPGGSFSQGDERGDGAADERPLRSVTLRRFLISRTEITFEQYDLFARETARALPSDNGWGRADRPVINVTWMDAVEYCNWRSAAEGFRPVYTVSGAGVTTDWSADGYRLPTESEWEYAARGVPAAAGTTAAGGVTGWHVGNAGARTHPVGGLAPNALGLYDMAGNVWEWCTDWYGPYPPGPAANPHGPEDGQRRVLRGGSWYDAAYGLRVSARNRQPPVLKLPIIGFRVVRATG